MHHPSILHDIQIESSTYSPLTDILLMKHVLNKEEKALLTLYQRYGTLVYSIALHVLNNKQDAEEVTQDVFLAVWEKGHQFDPERGKFIAWITRITRNKAINRLKKRRRREPDEELMSLDGSPQLWETINAKSNQEELRKNLAAAINRLSPEHQEVLSLAYFQGMSQREIAEVLKRPLGTIKSHIRQGMQRLRQIWLSQEEIKE